MSIHFEEFQQLFMEIKHCYTLAFEDLHHSESEAESHDVLKFQTAYVYERWHPRYIPIGLNLTLRYLYILHWWIIYSPYRIGNMLLSRHE
jgi:hypothetical protein